MWPSAWSLAALIVLLIGSFAHAQQAVTIPPLKNLYPNEIDSLFTECSRDAEGTHMTCHFVQVSVHLKLNPEEISEDMRKFDEEMKTELEKLQNITSKEFVKETKEWCQEKFWEQKYALKSAEIPKDLNVFWTDFVERQKRFCTRPTLQGLKELLDLIRVLGQKNSEKESKTCRVWAIPWRETFSLQTGGKWVSNRGPEGICGVVTISTLEAHDQEHKIPMKWTYETRKLVTNREPPWCDKLDESPATYSWRGQEKVLACEFIDFGF